MDARVAALIRLLLRDPGRLPGALDAWVAPLSAPADTPRTVVLPAYGGAREMANLTALLVLLLARFGVQVLVHGRAGGDGAARDGTHAMRADSPATTASVARPALVSTAAVLAELGFDPAGSVGEAEASLARDRVAYVPVSVLAPGLGALVSRRPGARRVADALVQLLDPFRGASYRVVSVSHACHAARMRRILASIRADAMFLVGTEGEPFADPRRQTQLEDFTAGVPSVFAPAEGPHATGQPSLPTSVDAPLTAAWISRVLAGEVPVPPPIVAQLACCLIGARRPTSG